MILQRSKAAVLFTLLWAGAAAGRAQAADCANPSDPADTMVPVGELCVDKYEASVWSAKNGGTQYGLSTTDYPCSQNGQDCPAGAAKPIYARSVPGVTPSAYITWFQAAMACANSGKHLLTNAEWQVAAAGTPDPGANGKAPDCQTSGTGPMITGEGTKCLSSWGAENMIGSEWEWVADWGQYGPDDAVAKGTFTTTAWSEGARYNNDGTWNVSGSAYTTEGGRNARVSGLPAAVVRGGAWRHGISAGVFAFAGHTAPSSTSSHIGLRCGRRR